MFVFVLIMSFMINYVSGIIINRFPNPTYGKFRTFVFAISVFANLGLLFYYKYFTFIVRNINSVFHADLTVKEIALPIGISFFTFQGMSYIIDLYRRNIPVQKNPISFALYISIFPKLIAGPIVRYADVYLQLDERKVEVDRFAYAVKRFIIGLSKKVLIANVLGEVADKIFATPYTQIDTATAWTGAICYMMQIFFDFSGYSDMAIGLGKMFGFDFMENFKLPYVSQSITEFWRRWHISLSTWFRDYVFLPISYDVSRKIPSEKVGFIKTDWVIYITGISITWLLIGLWHGASWAFLCWGLWHGMFIIIEKKLFRRRGIFAKLPGAAKWAYAMFIVLVGWVLFRSNGIGDACHYLQAMFNMVDHEFIRFSVWYYLDRQILFTLLVAAIASSTLPALFSAKAGKVVLIKNIVVFAKPVCLILLMLLNIIFVINSSYNPFIYFRF